MLNTINLICINSVFYLSIFSSTNCQKPIIFKNTIIDFMPVIPVIFFLSFCLASYYKFSVISLV
uniref:photosystem II subunit K n=1 Tax=Orobanche coerulescens TaxID=223100 RepID=UPI0022370352|nr:photosystem II subunit K [Orobanche coerulescens]UYR95009.1 photosystem II subunit K [Orobanche coerulescens]